MKAHILYDDSGEIGALHIVAEGEESDRGVRFSFGERPGVHVATVDVPVEFENLSLRELHAAVRVDPNRPEPGLIAYKSRILDR
jgi:hypothetical protein